MAQLVLVVYTTAVVIAQVKGTCVTISVAVVERVVRPDGKASIAIKIHCTL